MRVKPGVTAYFSLTSARICADLQYTSQLFWVRSLGFYSERLNAEHRAM
jgi:hypothetical protein